MRGILEYAQQDLNAILKDIFSSLVPQEICGFTSHRIGIVADNRPRPVKVCFASSSLARQVFVNRKNLKSKHADITLSFDRTPAQVKELAELNKSLKERRLLGEKNLTIKFVNGSPEIVVVDKRQREESCSPNERPVKRTSSA